MGKTMTLDELNTRIEDAVSAAIGKSLEPLKQQQEGLAKIFQRAAQPAPAPAEKGIEAARMLRALAASRCNKSEAIAIAKAWGDERLEKALAAGSATAGGYTISPQQSSELIELLRAASVVRRLGARVVSMPKGSIQIPKVTGGATASYVGENANITASQPAFGMVDLRRKKLASTVPISNDFLEFSDANNDAMVRDDTVASVQTAEDYNFLIGNGTENAPKGLRYLAASGNVFAANGTVNLANLVQDLGKAILKLRSANVPMRRPGWAMSPEQELYLQTLLDGNGNFVFRDEMSKGRVWGIPYASTTQLSSASAMILADFSEVLIGEVPGMRVESSNVATYYTPDGLVSAFAQDQTVVRVIVEHDIGLRHSEAVAVITGSGWAFS